MIHGLYISLMVTYDNYIIWIENLKNIYNISHHLSYLIIKY